MAKIRNQLIVFLSLAVAIAGAFVFSDITGLFGLETLTSGRNAFPNGTTAILWFDNYSSTYVDNSFVNPNVYAELCSDDPTNDLLDKYLSVYVVVGNNSLNLGVASVQMVASTINGSCAFVDVDLSLFSAFYPAIVSLGVSNYSNMSNVSFYNLTMVTGFLQGNFSIDPVNETPTNVAVNVRFPVDENNVTYYVETERLIVGIRNSTLDVVDSVITTLDSPVVLSRPAGGYIITINNIDGPGLFVPIVDIITPTDGQSITAGTPVLITVNVTGNITQVLVNVSWDSTSELLNATFNSVTGLWEASFTNSGALGLYNISAFAYDVNGGVGNDTSFFYIVAGPSGGGGSGGRTSSVIVPPVVPPPIVQPVVTVPPAVEEAVAAPVAPPAVAAPVAPVAPEKAAEAIEPCFIVEVLSCILLVLLIVCVLFYAVYTYVLKTPVGRWLEWLVWILIVILLALSLLYNLLCEGVLWWPLLGVILVLLLLLLKFVLSKQEQKQEVSAMPVPEVKEEYNYALKARDDLDKEIMKLEKSIRRMRK